MTLTSNLKTLTLISGLLAFPTQAQAQAPHAQTSLGFSAGSAGIGLGLVFTGQSRFGFFLTGGSTARSDEDLPVEGTFSWVNYTATDWKSKNYAQAGMAYRLSPRVTLGVGYSTFKREMYAYGRSPVTGLYWRQPAADESKAGAAVILDFGAVNGFGGQVFVAPGVVGASITVRFSSFR